MAITLDPSVGGLATNSYGSLVEADAYFEARLFSDAWTAVVVSDTKKAALISAFNRLEEEQFCGYKASVSQRSQWPRLSPYSDGYEDEMIAAVLNGTAIPREVIESQFELAIALLTRGQDASAPNALADFSALALPGGLSLTMADNLAKYNDDLPAVCNRKLQKFRTAVGYTKLVRS